MGNVNLGQHREERVVSESEQNHIMSTLGKSAEQMSQLETSKGQILSCDVCSFTTNRNRQRQDLIIHLVNFTTKVCISFANCVEIFTIQKGI